MPWLNQRCKSSVLTPVISLIFFYIFLLSPFWYSNHLMHYFLTISRRSHIEAIIQQTKQYPWFRSWRRRKLINNSFPLMFVVKANALSFNFNKNFLKWEMRRRKNTARLFFDEDSLRKIKSFRWVHHFWFKLNLFFPFNKFQYIKSIITEITFVNFLKNHHSLCLRRFADNMLNYKAHSNLAKKCNKLSNLVFHFIKQSKIFF